MRTIIAMVIAMTACTQPAPQQQDQGAGHLAHDAAEVVVVDAGSCVLQDVAFTGAANAPNAASFASVPTGAQDVTFWRGGPGGTYAFKLHFLSNGTDVYQFAVAQGEYMLTPVEIAPDIDQIAVENTTSESGLNYGRLIFAVGDDCSH